MRPAGDKREKNSVEQFNVKNYTKGHVTRLAISQNMISDYKQYDITVQGYIKDIAFIYFKTLHSLGYWVNHNSFNIQATKWLPFFFKNMPCSALDKFKLYTCTKNLVSFPL